MTKLINKNKLDVFTNKLWKRITKSFVSKTLHNNVSGETIFSNGHVEGSILRLFSNKNPNMLIGRGGSCFGVPSTSINAGMNVGKIAMAVDPSLEVGSTVSNVVALAVKKSNNTVKEIIVENQTATVYYNNNANLNAQKIIYININRSFNEEVYFLIGCDKMLWATDTYPITNAFGGPVPTVGTRLEIADYHYSGRFIIFSSRTSFEQLVGICNDSVSKTKNNILSGKTILQDAYISGDIYSIDNSNATDNSFANSDTKYSGTANKVITANTNVTSIVVAVRSSMNAGTVATGINVGVVRSDTNEIIEYVHQNSTGIVYENTYSQINASRVVNIPINKSWGQNVYFIVGVNGMLWNSPHGSLNLNRVTGGDSLPSVGHVINNLNTTNYIGKVVVLGEGINLNTLNNKVDISQVGNEANKIPRVGENGKLPSNILPAEVNGGVRTVNEISPVNGNVTVLASNIKYVNGQELTVKDAIDNKVNETDTVTSSRAHKIVKLDGSGKINDNMMPLTVAKRINNLDVNNNAVTIYSDNINISSSDSQKISEALGERAHKNQDNIFTKHNRFNDYSPTVHRPFTRKHINSDINPDNVAVYNANTYFAPLNEKYTERNKYITHVLLPIKGANVGDSISINYFIYNNNGTVIYQQTWAKNYTVIDEEVAGCKCAKIDVNRDSGNNGIGFGFAVFTSNVDGRSVGAACLKSAVGANVSWTSTTGPRVDQNLNSMSKTKFPYKICYETTSEVVTRFELEQVTQMYHKTLIGEYKNISYDAGNTLDDGMSTWLKANGQTVTNTDYPELFEKLNPNRTINDLDNIQVETFELPNETAAAGYYYICAK